MWSGWVQGNSIWSVMSFQWFCMVNMHLIKGTYIIFSCDLAGYKAIPMVHWYQWYDMVPIENDVIPMVLLVNMHLINLGLFFHVTWLGLEEGT